MQSFGDRLRKARTDAKLTQAQLARELGVTPSAISQAESGLSTSLNAENVVNAASITGKSARWLATGKGDERSLDMLERPLADMPPDDRQQTLDFIIYKIEKTVIPYVADAQTQASYLRMIEALRADLQKRREGDD